MENGTQSIENDLVCFRVLLYRHTLVINYISSSSLRYNVLASPNGRIYFAFVCTVLIRLLSRK